MSGFTSRTAQPSPNLSFWAQTWHLKPSIHWFHGLFCFKALPARVLFREHIFLLLSNLWVCAGYSSPWNVLFHPYVINSSYKRQWEGHLLQKMFFILQMGPHCLPWSVYTFVHRCPLWSHESPQGCASLIESNLQKLSLPVAVVGKDKQGVSAVTSFDEETV